jgi:hypothetical protein
MLHKFETAVTLHERIIGNILRKIHKRISRNAQKHIILAPLRQRTRRAWEQKDPGECCSHDSACRQLTPAVYMATKQGAEREECKFLSALPLPQLELGENPSPEAL